MEGPNFEVTSPDETTFFYRQCLLDNGDEVDGLSTDGLPEFTVRQSVKARNLARHVFKCMYSAIVDSEMFSRCHLDDVPESREVVHKVTYATPTRHSNKVLIEIKSTERLRCVSFKPPPGTNTTRFLVEVAAKLLDLNVQLIPIGNDRFIVELRREEFSDNYAASFVYLLTRFTDTPFEIKIGPGM